MKKIVILGAGYAGIETAKLIEKKLRRRDDVEITVIDKNSYHTLMTELHEVAGWRTEEDSVRINLDKIFSGRKINLKRDLIDEIDFEKRILKSESQTYEYDYLVLGTGSQPEFYGIKGIKEYGFTLWSYEDAMKIRHHIKDCFEKASVETDLNKRKQLLTFAVAGGGFTGVEMAGELGEIVPIFCEKYNINKDEVKLYLVEGGNKILPIFSEKQIQKAEKRLEKLGFEILKQSFICEHTNEGFLLKEKERIDTKTLIWAAGIKVSEIGEKVELTKNEKGRLLADKYLKAEGKDGVYLVGDNIGYKEEKGYTPQIVEAAIQSGKTVAKNILANIQGEKETEFKPEYHGFMVSIGGRYAISDTMGMKMSGFFAMALKHLINLHYLVLLGGLNLVWSYMNHEFFRMENRRSIMGGHISERTVNFWLVPLRIYVGSMWVYESIKKIQEGWLNPSNIKIIVNATSGASASGNGDWTQAAQQVEPLLKEMPFFMDWIMNHIVAINPFLFQSSIVITELIIGILIIVGLFTFISSGISVVLTFMFLLSAMADASILWYTFAGIALMGGAGRIFGLDYYIMPVIKKYWNKTKFAKKNYLYID